MSSALKELMAATPVGNEGLLRMVMFLVFTLKKILPTAFTLNLPITVLTGGLGTVMLALPLLGKVPTV
jgi:hypothetical protein